MNNMRLALSQSALGPAILSQEQGEQNFFFGQDFIGFQGHFPGYPILPAILQALLAHQLAEQVANHPLIFTSLSRAKFIRQIRPENNVTVQLEFQPSALYTKCMVKLLHEQQMASTFTLSFATPQNAP